MIKRGQHNASSAAILVIVVTALIVLYILFLPPGDRAELLGEGSGTTYTGGTSGNGGTASAPSMTLLRENVGRVVSLSRDEFEHTLPSFRINTRTDGSIIHEMSSLYVKSSIFDAVIKNVSFRIDEETTSDLKLSFNVGAEADGRLIILLNNQQIFNDDIRADANGVIDLQGDLLQRYNVLTIGASSPGWAFWHANEYTLRDVQIIGNVRDVSGATSRQTFILSEQEVENLDRALLRFYADCAAGSGRLTIEVNGRTMSSSFIECGVLSKVELDERFLDIGQNEVEFSIDSGNYLISNALVRTYLEDPIYPTYYFEFDDRYFTAPRDDDEGWCGEVDGYCPSGCDADEDSDCCFEDDGYWCDVEPSQFDDRCVSYVTDSTCGRCASGYEDDRGRAPEACEGLCGDDRDGECPVGCSKYLDRDCCFEDDAYWCDDVPVAKPLSAVCKLGVDPDERDDCPSRYYDDAGRRLSYDNDEDYDDEDELRSSYSAMLYLAFPDDDFKSVTLLINGREVGLETRRTSFEKDISSYVRPGTNSIQVQPYRSVDITSLQVKVEK